MILDLVANLTLFTTFLFFTNRFYSKKEVTPNSSVWLKITVGVFHGIFGILLMFFSVKVSPGAIIDFRQLAIIAAAHSGGVYASLTAGVLIAAGRITLLGGSHASYIAAVCSALLAGAGMGLISHYVQKKIQRWSYYISFQVLITSVSIYLLLGKTAMDILPEFVSLTILGGIMNYYLIDYLTNLNTLEKQLKNSEKEYRRLIEYSPDAVCVHMDGKVLYANDKALHLFGVPSMDDLVGLFNYIHPDYREKILDKIELLRQQHSFTFNIESLFISPDGKISSIDAAVSRIIYSGVPSILVSFRDVTESKEIQRKLTEANLILNELSSQDGLTQIYNRRFFDLALEREWGAAFCYSKPLSLIMCDIDHFKVYNDTYGHQGGDACLQSVASTLKSVLKRPADFVARFGGEEFVIVLPDTDVNGAFLIAQSLRKKIEDQGIRHIHSKVSHVVTISVGVATLIPNTLQSSNILVEFADKALYQAKFAGRNQVVRYNDGYEIKLNGFSGDNHGLQAESIHGNIPSVSP